jgi:iron(III) transport system permease protein
MPLLGVTVALFGLQHWITRRKGYVALTGKGGERRMIKLGWARWAMLGWCLLVVALAVFLPYLALSQAAFTRAWGQGLSWSNFSLANFHYILFEHHTAQQSVINSFVYATWTAFLAVGLALAIAYIVTRNLLPFGKLLGFLCMAPFVIPGIVLAIGFYAAYAPPPLALYGTAAILILAFTTRFLPIAYANAAAAMRSLNPEMEEAVRILGGSRLTAIRRVVAPLLKRSLVGAWLLVFIPATRELSAAIFLYGPNTRTMAVMLFDLSEEGNFEHLSALGLLLLAGTLIIVAVGYRVIGRDFMVRGGS